MREIAAAARGDGDGAKELGHRLRRRTGQEATGIFHPYVPRIVSAWSPDDPNLREEDATLLFLDISGFTALSERLARRGREGAETVTDVLNGVFGSLLDIGAEYGGDLLKFGGDALLLGFRGTEHAPRATRAAFEMRASLRHVGSKRATEGVGLRASFGLASGRVLFLLAGREYAELVVLGPTVTASLRAEQHADSGEVLASTTTASMLPRNLLGTPRSGGFFPVLSRPREVPKPAYVNAARRELDRCVAPRIAAAIDAGSLPGEHRAVAVAFIKFKAGVDDAAEVEALVSDAQATTRRLGICLLATDVDAEGGKLIVVAGVPTSVDDPASLVLLAARELVAGPRRLSKSAGIHYGHVFAGDIGSADRRIYTVIGDTVNTAARVMAAAGEGEVLASPTVLDASRLGFELGEVQTFAAKGKREQLVARPVFRATSAQEAAYGGEPPFVGRSAELARLGATFAKLGDGHVVYVDICGEPGIGKSRLVREFVGSCGEVRVLRATTGAHVRLTPYAAAAHLPRGPRDSLRCHAGGCGDFARASCQSARAALAFPAAPGCTHVPR